MYEISLELLGIDETFHMLALLKVIQIKISSHGNVTFSRHSDSIGWITCNKAKKVSLIFEYIKI